MKTIIRYFDTIKEAEEFQNDLYERYDYVKLTSAPRFSEEGYYTWEVKETV